MTVPRIRFSGSDNAKQMNRIFAENLQDLLNKVDNGEGEYAPGFFHTSTLQHEGTCYYRDIWSRDAGRGLIELARFGFGREAGMVTDYLLDNINMDDHWGRTIQHSDGRYETDGNALLLLGFYNTWKIGGMKKIQGKRYLEAVMPVFQWMERMMDACPYGALLPCESELAGNPGTPYQVYAIFPNYAAKMAMAAFSGMAAYCRMEREALYLGGLGKRLSDSLKSSMISVKQQTQNILTPQGCWLNGLDGRDGRAYEFAEFSGTSWPAYHWTRQLPFILESDLNGFLLNDDVFHDTNLKSYKHIHDWMCTGKYFRKYGFVSNTGWTGMGGRHDDTMCGYGQGFMTQAALMTDDINTYSKLAEGIVRLAYDGDVVKPLAFDMNPWIMHECFNYDNYENGYDHTFGVLNLDMPGIRRNYPGDEGNLVQEAEIIKAVALIAGIDNTGPGRLRIIPRLPWTWDGIQVKDFPVTDDSGNEARIDFEMEHQRWLRKCSFTLTASIPLKHVDIRVGPFPAHMEIGDGDNLVVERNGSGSWVWVNNLSGSRIEREIILKR